MSIRPFRLFFIGISVLLYVALSIVLLGGVAPAMVSSSDSILAGIGFLVPAMWLLATGCLALHFTLKFRATADKQVPTTENDQ